MRSTRGRMLAALLLVSLVPAAAAQDSAGVRHLLWLDVSRLQPFARTYDMVVRQGDSSSVIGERRVALHRSAYAGVAAWLLVETRTGAVASVESLYVATDFRPLHWSATLGPARLAAEFAGDSLLGAVTLARSKQNIVVMGRPDLVVSGAMLEAMLPLLPLSDSWSDSVGVLAVNAATTTVIPGELAVVALDGAIGAESAGAWIVALRTERSTNAYTVDPGTGITVRVVQQVPVHVGTMLEFRLRRDPPPG